QFGGWVVRLDAHAPAVLEAVRSSRSNHRMLLYGILPRESDVRRFSKFGINTLIKSPVERSNAVHVARSTCSLLLNALRRYVRIPVVLELSIARLVGDLPGPTRQISGAGMYVQLAGMASQADNLRLAVTLHGHYAQAT